MLDLTVISLISAVLRLNYSGLTAVCVIAELGLLKGWIHFLSPQGTCWQWLCRSCPHTDLSAWQATTLCHLPADISKIPSAI